MKVGMIPCFDDKQYTFNVAYLSFVTKKLGAEPAVILRAKDVVDVDAILLMGGRDIDPTLFNYNNTFSTNINREMDLFQIACVDEAVNNGKDIYGICRGLQLLAYMFLIPKYKEVYYRQDIDGHDQTNLSVPRPNVFHMVVELKTGKSIFVNSMHHQAVLVPIPVVIPDVTYTTTIGAPKGYCVVEGFQMIHEKSSITAWQWHPEELLK